MQRRRPWARLSHQTHTRVLEQINSSVMTNYRQNLTHSSRTRPAFRGMRNTLRALLFIPLVL